MQALRLTRFLTECLIISTLIMLLKKTFFQVFKGNKIEFVKTIGDEHLVVEAVISSDKIFKIPKQKAGKFRAEKFVLQVKFY